MFRFSLETNDVQASTRTIKSVFLRTLGRSNSVCLYRCAKEGTFMLCAPKMQIALVPIKRKIKLNVVDTFIRVSVFFIYFVLAFFTTAIVKQLYYTYIRCYMLITFCYIWSAVVLLGLPAYAFSLFNILLPIDYPNIWLDSSQTLLWIVQRHEFALHIDLVTFTLLPGWIILVNLGARWQKSQVITTMFDLVNYSSSSECGLLVSSSLIWNTANWIFDGSNH